MISDQKKEIENKIFEFNTNFPRFPKPSSEILNSKKIIKGMVKQKCYDKANNLQLVINTMVSSEQEKWDVVREKKRKFDLDVLKNKQDIDMFNFNVKINKNSNDSKKHRLNESEKLCNKFKNKMKELDLVHNIELSEFKNINVYNARMLSCEISSIISIFIFKKKLRKID